MKKWLIDDLTIQYNKHLINRWHEKVIMKKRRLFLKYISIKKLPKINLKKKLSKDQNEKIKIIVRLGLDSKDCPGIQMADIILPMAYKEIIKGLAKPMNSKNILRKKQISKQQFPKRERK